MLDVPVPTSQPVLLVRGDGVFADSREVARFFHKRHDHVIRDIKRLLAQAPECAPKFGEFRIKDLSGESVSHFNMDRDGFSLLAMGFTGVKALHWKLRWIEAFNRMEAELRVKAAKPVRVRQHRRALPAPKTRLSDEAMIRVVFANLRQLLCEADENRNKHAGSFAEMLIDAVGGFLGTPDSMRIPKTDKGPMPFDDGSNVLLDLQSAAMSANLRIEKGQERDFGKALESVFGDLLSRREGSAGSGKALVDWNWRRTQTNRGNPPPRVPHLRVAAG